MSPALSTTIHMTKWVSVPSLARVHIIYAVVLLCPAQLGQNTEFFKKKKIHLNLLTIITRM